MIQPVLTNQPATVNDPKVARMVENSRAENTKRAYLSDWATFSGWCSARGVSAMPATPSTVASFVADAATTRKASTVGRYVASISTAHKMAGHPSPCHHELVRSTLRGMRRELGTAQRKAQPVRIKNIRAALESFDGSPKCVRDRALVLLGFAGAFRRSELVALDRADVELTTDGLVVTVRRSKTDQEAAGTRKAIPYGANPSTCPVRAVLAWFELLGAFTGPVFRPVDKAGRVADTRLSDKAVCLVLKNLAANMGLDAAQVSGHSLRAGMVTDAFAVGVSEAVIMNQTGHRSCAVMAGYRREANLFAQNAAAALGL